MGDPAVWSPCEAPTQRVPTNGRDPLRSAVSVNQVVTVAAMPCFTSHSANSAAMAALFSSSIIM